jgi:hypothetical protein
MSVTPPDPAPSNPPQSWDEPALRSSQNGRDGGAGREDQPDPTAPFPIEAQLATIKDSIAGLEQQVKAVNMGLLCAGLGVVMLAMAILKSKGAAATVA